MSKDQSTILIVEDNRDLLNLLEINLSDQGYVIHTSENGEDALEKYKNISPDLLILDVMLPRIDGLEVCKRIRKHDRSLPILMLTAKSEELDKVLGLELGADDYMTKPFSIRELLARIKAIFRRIDAQQEELKEGGRVLEFDHLILDTAKRKVTLHGETIELTSKEYDLLLLFFSNPGKSYSREELLNIVWGYSYEGYSHTVNSHINRLRSKIEEELSEPHFIRTVWGVGYRFADKEESLSYE
jgi:DNA-binding response OmpR family regulator